MAEEAQAEPLRVISGDVARGEGVRALLQMVLRDHAAFSGLMVVAVLPGEDRESNDCRVYATNLNYLEKLGLLQQAKETLR